MKDSIYSLALRYIGRVLRTMQYGEPLPNLPTGLDWRGVYHVSKEHSLAGTLWYFISDLVKTDCSESDAELIESWERECSIAFAQNFVQTAEFVHLTDALTKAEIKFLPLKGFIFKKLWRKSEYRTMTDMDIYFGNDQMDRVSEKLLALGYRFDHGSMIHDAFVKPPYLKIEAHKLLRDDSNDGFECWQAKGDNPYWYEMSDVDLMLFNVAHIYKHYINGGCGARSLFDLQLFIEQKPNIVNNPLLLERLSQENMLDFYHDMLHLMHFWYGDGTGKEYASDTDLLIDGAPTDKLCEMEYYVATGGAYGLECNKVEYNLVKRGRVRYYLSRMFLPYKSMCETYPWLRRAPILLPAAYVIRWFRSISNGRLKNELRLIKRADKKLADKTSDTPEATNK